MRPSRAGFPGPRRGGVRVGALVVTAEEVRGELDRVNARWLALKRAVATSLPLEDATRAEFGNAFTAWRRFYVDARENWFGWSGTREEAGRHDAEADAWRARLEEMGIATANPTRSTTAPRSGPWATSGQVLFGLALLGGIVYLATRSGDG